MHADLVMHEAFMLLLGQTGYKAECYCAYPRLTVCASISE